LVCESTINLLGGTLVIKNAIQLKNNCQINVKDHTKIQIGSRSVEISNLSINFQSSNGNSIVEWLGDGFDLKIKALTGDEPPKFLFNSKNVSIAREASSTAPLSLIQQLSVDYANSFVGLHFSDISINQLLLSNANTQSSFINIPNIPIQNITLNKIKANGIDNSLQILNITQSLVKLNNAINIGNLVSTISSIDVESTITVTGISNLLDTPLSIIGSTSQLNLNSQLQILTTATSTIQNVVTGSGNLVLSNTGKLVLGDISSLSSAITYQLSNQISTVTGSVISTVGSLLIPSQNNVLSGVAVFAKELLVNSGQLLLEDGLLNIDQKIEFLTKGIANLTNTVVKIGTSVTNNEFLDLLVENLDLNLKSAILQIENLELPNRLRLGVGSTLQLVEELSLETSNPIIEQLDDLNLITVFSEENNILCNGFLQNATSLAGLGSLYQFICDEKMIVLRLNNCSGVRCLDGRCVNSIDNCPSSNGTCPNLTCWNGDCTTDYKLCPATPSCQPNQLHCQDGCFSNRTECPTTCTGPSCIPLDTPYQGCPLNNYLCPNGTCVNDLSECCSLGLECYTIQSTLKPVLSLSPIQTTKDLSIPIIYKNNQISGLDIYGYIHVPNEFIPSYYFDKMRISQVDDSYLDKVNSSIEWADYNFRDVSMSMIFDVSLNNLASSLVFDKPITIELKIPDAQSLNLTNICLFFVNTTSNQWQCESSVTLTSRNTIVGTTPHFTNFGVLVNSKPQKPKPTSAPSTTSQSTFVSLTQTATTTSASSTSTNNPTTTTSGSGGTNTGNTNSGSTTGGSNPNPTNEEPEYIQDDEKTEGWTTKKTIITSTTIAGGAVIVGVVAAFFITKSLKHGQVSHWWKTRKPPRSSINLESMN